MTKEKIEEILYEVEKLKENKEFEKIKKLLEEVHIKYMDYNLAIELVDAYFNIGLEKKTIEPFKTAIYILEKYKEQGENDYRWNKLMSSILGIISEENYKIAIKYVKRWGELNEDDREITSNIIEGYSHLIQRNIFERISELVDIKFSKEYYETIEDFARYLYLNDKNDYEFIKSTVNECSELIVTYEAIIENENELLLNEKLIGENMVSCKLYADNGKSFTLLEFLFKMNNQIYNKELDGNDTLEIIEFMGEKVYQEFFLKFRKKYFITKVN